MWRFLKKRVAAGAMAAVMLLVNVVMPVQPVFATTEGEDEPAVSAQDTTGDQPVWCQYTNVWTAQIGNTGGGNNKNRFPLLELPNGYEGDLLYIGEDGQVYAPNSNDDALKGLLDATCEQQSELDIPATPAIDDPCGEGNAEWIVPEDDKYGVLHWEVDGDGNLIVTIVEKGFVFTDGELSHNYGVATDSGELCPPEEIPTPTMPEVNDPCGLDNAEWTATPEDTDTVSWSYDEDGNLVATAAEGYVFDNGKTSVTFYLEDSDDLCEAESEKPKFVDHCGVLNDYYIVKDTENVAYYVDDEMVKPGVKNYVTDASKVTVVAEVTDDDYEIVNSTEYTKQFTDKACRAKVELEAGAWCDADLDTRIKAVITNTTKSWQAYEVVVTDGDSNELAAKVVVVPAGETEKLYKTFEGDGEFTVSIYSFNKEKRGKLLAEQAVMTECIDTFTPEIYKKNQDGAILSTGTFDVEVCQPRDTFARIVMEDEYDGCKTYEDVVFGTDGSWFANNVEYETNVPTTVTITETEAPVGCTLSTTPWVFTWSYSDVQLMSRYMAMTGSWDTEDGTNVFNLYNDCDQPGQGEYTPTPATPVETLAETGDSENAILGVVAGMLLTSIALAISPRLRRSGV